MKKEKKEAKDPKRGYPYSQKASHPPPKPLSKSNPTPNPGSKKEKEKHRPIPKPAPSSYGVYLRK